MPPTEWGALLYLGAVVVIAAVAWLIISLGRSAAVGDNIALRAQEDRDIDDAAMRARIFSDPHRFDQDHEAGR